MKSLMMSKIASAKSKLSKEEAMEPVDNMAEEAMEAPAKKKKAKKKGPPKNMAELKALAKSYGKK